MTITLELQPEKQRRLEALATRSGRDVTGFLTDMIERAIRDAAGEPAAEDHPLAASWQRLDALRELGEGWNGRDVAAPLPAAIERAKAWLEALYGEAGALGRGWTPPHVGANEDGHVAFEWARGRRRLSVLVSPSEAWYVKAWGPSVAEEMADGSADTAEERAALWSWLTE